MFLDVLTITNLTGVTEQAVQKACLAGRYAARKVPSPGRQGWKYEIALASLPKEVQERYWREQVEARVAEESLDALKRWAQSKAVRLTQKELANPAVAKKLHVARTLEECPKYLGRVAVADALGAKYGVKRVQVYRWWNEVKTWRVKAKTPVVVTGDFKIELPRSNAFERDALAFGVACHAANLPQGRQWAFDQLQAQAQQRGWRIGDYTSFCRLLNKVPGGVWDAIKKGSTGFELQIAPKITRAWLEVPAYDVLCGDQNILDYLVLDETTGEILVMNLYLWMDCTSRAWTGIWPAFGPYRGYTVGASLREACRLALPGEIYTDWGKCELSQYVTDTRMSLSRYAGVGDFSGMGGRYGDIGGDDDGEIKHRKARPGTPWLKPIENQMNILKRGLLDLNLPGYRQKLDEPWANKVRQMDLRMAMRGGHLLTLEQMMDAVLKVMDRHNREECKLRELHGGTIVPGRVLAEGLRSQSRTVLRDETLDYLFLPKWERTAHRGLVTVKVGPHDTREFFLSALTKLSKADRKVRVYVDPYDPEAPAKITTLSGDFLGLGEPWGTVKPGDDEALTRMIRAQKKLLKGWRENVARLMAPYSGLGTERLGDADKPAREAGRAEQERQAIRNATAGADSKLIELFNRGKRA